MFKPRPRQAEILSYESGRMGIPAVPGSGKTHTLSYLAALLITKGLVADDQEILIVTLVNSAVDNFSNRVSRFVQQAGLLQKMGYRVRTLHGLAHDIIKERPDLAGVSEQFSIIDENECRLIIEQITSAYLRDHPELTDEYLDPIIELEKEYSTQKQWFSLFADNASSFIGQAKDFQLDPQQLKTMVETGQISHPLFDFGVEVYAEYQRGLRFRNALDFADLTRLAVRVLDSDLDFLARLQHRWPYILEDEAQDSSAIQETILRKLAGANGNWVRVGDTNQAIYDTFTTADPEFLRRFLVEQTVVRKDLPNSGRSNQSILNLANYLIKWTNEEHPVETLRGSLSIPYIEPAPPGDPQPNPPDHPEAIYIQKQPLTPEAETNMVARSIEKWLLDNKEKTVAVLCPIGRYAEQVVEALQRNGVEVVELLQSSNRTRKVTRLIEKCLASLSDPSSIVKFSAAFELFKRFDEEIQTEDFQYASLFARLRKVNQLEDLLYPNTPVDVLTIKIDETLLKYEPLLTFNAYMRWWHSAAPLPIDQLILVIGSDLFTKPQDLALTHKLSLMLEFAARNNPEYRLPQFIAELSEISNNERKFLGFSDDDSGFNPEIHKGKVLVTTYHKAKGLEWDRVYLMSVNNYDFPSLQENDQYKGEKWFIRGKLNLESELLSLLKHAAKGDFTSPLILTNTATMMSRKEYAAERLRLFYVGITRARETLIITWNTGKRENCTISLPLKALNSFWEANHNAPS
jgi:DNA helicase-2/ATP-dependent DNA helicase PcrA